MKGQRQEWKQGRQQAGCPSTQHLLVESPLCWLWGRQENSRVRQVNSETGKGDRDDERQGTQDPERGGSPTMGGGNTKGLPVEGAVG